MIDSISIADTATYGKDSQPMDGLKEINYVFGSNGVGKTTISRVIADESAYPSCSVSWQNGSPLQTLVYNRDFVQKHFHEVPELPGIFTLGKDNADALKKIPTAKAQLGDLEGRLTKLNDVLNGSNDGSGKQAELERIEETLKNACWDQMLKHPAFKSAFAGFRDKKEKFKDKLLSERTKSGVALVELTDLEVKAKAVFDDNLKTIDEVSSLRTENILKLETAPILAKRVLGRTDVDIADMIQKLGNSDWVKQGRPFFEANEGICPFCQNPAPESLEESLNSYFDESFATDTSTIATLESDYELEGKSISTSLALLIDSDNEFLDTDALKVQKELYDTKLSANLKTLAAKIAEPSQKYALVSLQQVLEAIAALIESANKKTRARNKLVSNSTKERQKLTNEIWRYLIDKELATALSTYDTEKEDVSKSIAALESKIDQAKMEISAKTAEIEELERATTSIQPTIDDINRILSGFGFVGFSLKQAEKSRCYKLVREDGSNAKDTLSEGERSFVTFLYFYHLLKGSNSDSGITQDRVVVFDDPVSSLDSDTLFIVGCLIKALFKEAEGGTGSIKQIFVLTHNVYFHKEISYNSNRKTVAMKRESFWVIRKSGTLSTIHNYAFNPIKTSYELLWNEVRESTPSNLTIQNTLRRILENYFKILGNIDFDTICEMFEGKDKIICRSLFSWAHDGSHYAYDDLFVANEQTKVETYLDVFRKIFEASNHSQHYKMMMGDAYVERAEEAIDDTDAEEPAPVV